MGEPYRARDEKDDPFNRWFRQSDENGDGQISRLELKHDAEAFFEVLDANKDKVIDADEIERYETEIAPGRVRAAGGPVAGNAGFGGTGQKAPVAKDGQVPIVPDSMAPSKTRIQIGGGPPIDVRNVPDPVAMADVNLDRRVTPDEFTKAAGRRFTNYDANQDNQLSVAELDGSRRR
jgi:hypothetical protein